MNAVVMGTGYVTLHTGVQVEKSCTDAIAKLIMRLYLNFPEVYKALVLAQGREEAVVDAFVLEILQSETPGGVAVLYPDNRLTRVTEAVVRSMLILSISGEPHSPYPSFE